MQTKAFERIFIVILENETEDAVLKNSYMRSLQSRGVRLSDSHGVTHPSQPNYIAATCGAPLVFNDDCQNVDATNIVDLLEAGGVTWKAYMEDLPADKIQCNVGKYFRKHNPFISYNNIRENPKRLERIVEAGQLQLDLAANALPEYSWYTPNIFDDGHTPESVDGLAAWLEKFLEPLLKDEKFTKGSLVVVTFDESIPYGSNHVYTTLLGSMVKAGSVQSGHYDHYSLLRTIEENWNLGSLNRFDRTANYFSFLWNAPPPAVNMALHTQVAVAPAAPALSAKASLAAAPSQAAPSFAMTPWNRIFEGVQHAVGVAAIAQGVIPPCTRIQRVNLLQVDLQATGVELVITPADRDDTITGFMSKNPALRVAVDAGNLSLVVHKNRTAKFYLQSELKQIGIEDMQTAVSGGPPFILSGGKIQAVAVAAPEEGLAPRTGAGLDLTGRYLYLATIDGMEGHSTFGAAFYDLAFWLQQAGSSDAINLDGGGSTAMAIASEYGPVLLNTPYGDDRTPGLQRPVGIFLGIVAHPSAQRGA